MSKMTSKRKLLIGGSLFVVFAVAAGVGIYYKFFHYENAEISESSAESYFPTEKKFVVLPGVEDGVNASVQLLEHQSTVDDSVLYFVNVTFTGEQENTSTRRAYLRQAGHEERERRDQDANGNLDFFVSENEFVGSVEYQDLSDQLTDGMAEKFNLMSGAVGVYQFQTHFDDPVGVAFADNSKQQVQAFANFADAPNLPGPLIFANSMPSSSQYPTSGTISFVRRYKTDINTGNTLTFTTLKFIDINPPNAPGAMIYLSPKAGGKKINDAGVVPIEIEQAEKNGWYTVSGTFEQEAPVGYDENANYQEIIVWCEPFGIYLGGGAIEYTEQ